ncbi:LacI family DNA-binding transcriptional regulator, partial [Bifidobacterium longum]|uniref:LacI family DNA-binding transcriptional regulator n=1 Tax=Bifidobacterium longum TaxID=216816 RepID=UPI00321935D1
MVTMKEIANKAGVSVSTVSLVLNGRDEGRVKSKIADNGVIGQNVCPFWLVFLCGSGRFSCSS